MTTKVRGKILGLVKLGSAAVGLVLLTGCPAKRPEAPPTPVSETKPAPPPPAQAPVSPLPARGNVVEPSPVVPADFRLSGESQVEFYGNFETAGVIASMPSGLPSNRIGRVRCFLNVGGQWQPMHDLVQVNNFPWFATSLFWLKPASRYQVKVVFEDRTGQPLITWYGQGDTRPEPHLAESKDCVYVATMGDDANPGTEQKPFRTLQHAFAVAKAGQTIYVRGGVYYEGQLEFGYNGQTHAPIAVRAYPGERVVIDASDPDAMDPAGWTAVGDRIYSRPYAFVTMNACVETKDGSRVVRLFPVKTLEELKTRTINAGQDQGGKLSFEKMGIEGAVFCDGRMAYIAVPEPLEQYRVRLPQQNRAIVIEHRRNIQIEGLEINYFGQGEYNTAVFVYNSTDILIQNCRFNYDASFVYVKGQTDRLTIQDCAFKDAILEWPFGYMKGASGIAGYFEGGTVNVDAKYSGRGLVFRRNRIENVFDGAHLTPWTEDDARTQETDFYQNYIDGCIDDFIEVDGFARNVRIFDNFMNRSLSGVSLAQALDGPTFVVYNVIANCGMVPAAQREENYGYPFKTNGGPQADIGSGPIFFYHNTAWTQDPNSRAMLVKRARWKKITLRNNIWCGRKLGFEVWEELPSPMDFDYDNLYVAEPGAPLVLRAYRTKYMTLEEVRDKLKYLQHGISADPQFADPENNVFTLKPESPCVDAGIVVPGINDQRILGAAPDMGAYECR